MGSYNPVSRPLDKNDPISYERMIPALGSRYGITGKSKMKRESPAESTAGFVKDRVKLKVPMVHRKTTACIISCLTILLSILLYASPASSEPFFDRFKDPKDGAFDTSEWLIERSGFLPVPIFISDPAVGYGGGMALLFFPQ